VEAIIEGLVSGAVEIGLPIVLKRTFLRWKKPRVYVLFSLILEYYEMPLLEDLDRIINSCLDKFRIEGRYLSYDSTRFRYVVNHEVDDRIISPDLDEYESDVEFGIPSYVSLSGIRLYPHIEKEVSNIEGKKIIIAAYKLMNQIIHTINISTEASDLLRIKSTTKLMAITSESTFIKKFTR